MHAETRALPHPRRSKLTVRAVRSRVRVSLCARVPTQLLFDAGMLMRNADGHVEVVVERTVAMLALTAIHDIMKVTCLLPAVSDADAGYHEMEAGTVIQDHDLALGYVLQTDGASLPSFDALPSRQRAAVMFTQAEVSTPADAGIHAHTHSQLHPQCITPQWLCCWRPLTRCLSECRARACVCVAAARLQPRLARAGGGAARPPL